MTQIAIVLNERLTINSKVKFFFWIIIKDKKIKFWIKSNKKYPKKDTTKTNQTTAKLIELFDGEILN